MNEQLARDVVLVRAVEVTDAKNEVLNADDRLYASRSARELAQWQASESGTAVTSEHFLQQRSALLIKRLVERHPTLAPFLGRRSALKGLGVALPLFALLLGAGLDRIGDPHRVDLLSPPLLGIIAWNLLAYLLFAVWMFVPSARHGATWLRSLQNAKVVLPRKLPNVLSAALAEFALEWTRLSVPLNRARIGRALHLSAALFALGAILSLYARGLFTEYRAGWESTFLDASQVHAILSVLFAPAQALLPLQGFTLGEIDALRFSNPPSNAGGARWVHFYGATLFLIVVLPRLVLAGFDHWRVKRRTEHFRLNLDTPYFRKLGEHVGVAGPAVMRVLPYSFTIDEARDKGLAQIAATLFGDHARVMLRPVASYGEEADDALHDIDLADPSIGVTVVLFNLAATPEKENHGAFLDYLRNRARRGVAALIDESSLAERTEPERVAERAALWQQFCQFHGVPATVVNLLDPQFLPLDPNAGLPLSKVP